MIGDLAVPSPEGKDELGDRASVFGASNPPRMMTCELSTDEVSPLSAVVPDFAAEGEALRFDGLLAALSFDASISACSMYLLDSASKSALI